MEEKIKKAYERFQEMEEREKEFLKDYRETGNKMSLELARKEREAKDKLMKAIMKEKRGG